jgi:hypothetical protein
MSAKTVIELNHSRCHAQSYGKVRRTTGGRFDRKEALTNRLFARRAGVHVDLHAHRYFDDFWSLPSHLRSPPAPSRVLPRWPTIELPSKRCKRTLRLQHPKMKRASPDRRDRPLERSARRESFLRRAFRRGEGATRMSLRQLAGKCGTGGAGCDQRRTRVNRQGQTSRLSIAKRTSSEDERRPSF